MPVIPLLILIAVFSMGLRISNLWEDTQRIEGSLFAQAQAANEAKPEPKAADEPAAIEGGETGETGAVAEGDAAKAGAHNDDQPMPELLKGLSLMEDEGDFDVDFARSEIEVLQNLSERRKELDVKESSLERKEAVLKATEQQISQKIAELTSLRDDLKELLKEQSEQENKRISSLVRIYEGMKPSDAANILNSLETDILISVMERMSERKSAPILAAMDPERAREVTTLLAERKQLPDLDL